ncbi:MAG: transporter substrate-binding domain-containing protein [Gammaproteobacteria bacterium]|nr:transporter substrate-binding domain-containing protein [Gammaproteobacteria bacterium]
MRYRRQAPLFLTLLFLLPLVLLGSCGSGEEDVAAPASAAAEDELLDLIESVGEARFGDLDAMRERGVLRALVTYSRTDFFLDRGRIRGIQAEFLREFEKQLNAGIEDPTRRIRVHFLPVAFDRLIPALNAGLGDVAAAFLTVTPERLEMVDFAASRRMVVDEIVVTHGAVAAPEGLEDLAGHEVYVLRDSSYAEHLRGLNEDFRERGLAPVTVMEADPHLLSEDILEMVNAGIVDITVVDSYRAELWARVLPDLVLHHDLRIAEENPVGWAVRQTNPRLKAELDSFIAAKGKGSLIGNILFRKYFESTEWIEDPTEGEGRRVDRYFALFRKYGQRYGFDELVLAALAFQESGLRHDRRSHRGAVGIMQLLPSTAADPNVGIPDITDVEDNIHAGAKYLAFLRDRYFSDPGIGEADRRALTWAAYNAGPAKVRRMRELTAELGLDPDVWFGNVEVAAGRIVGRETVDYVANIQKYYVAYQLARRVREVKDGALAAGSGDGGAKP